MATGEQTAGGATLSAGDYRTLRQATETHRAELVVRLAGEVGLRPGEIAAIRPSHVRTVDLDGTEHHYLAVPDQSADEDEVVDRQAYLPADVEHDLRQYVRTAGIDADERILSVTPRRIQMLVSEVADRAIERSGDSHLGEVTTRTLRQYFARQLLGDANMSPTVVRAIGGWESLASLESYLEVPTVSEIARAFERTGLASQSGQRPPDEAFRRAVEHSGHSIYVTDREGVIEYVNPAFEMMTGYTAAEAIGRTPRILKSGEHDEAFYADLWETILDGEVWEGDLVNERKDGEQYRVHQTIAPIETDGDIERFVAVNTAQSDGRVDVASGFGSGRLADVLDRLVAVGETLDTASTREEIEQSTCETLVAGGCYEFAWLAELTGEELRLRSHAGIDTDRLNRLVTGDGATRAAHRSDEVQVAADVATAPELEAWQADASEHGYDVAVAIPVRAGETGYGVLHLAVDASEVPSGTEAGLPGYERDLLADFGRRLGNALAAAEQRKLLLADTVVELTFRTGAPDSFFATASAHHGCRLELEGVVPGEEGSLLYFVTLSGSEPEAVLGWAREREEVGDVRLIRDHGDESLVEIVLTAGDVSTALVQRGATVRELTAADGTQRVVSAVPAGTDVRGFVSDLTDAVPGTELLTKREREQAAESATAFRSSLQESLTEKQSAVLQAAYHAGYFEWPRGSTAEELAASIGITSPTLHNHLRRAQQKLLQSFYEDADQRPGSVTLWDEN